MTARIARVSGGSPLASPLPGIATVHDLTPILFPEWHDRKYVAGFAPLVAGCAPDRAAILVEQLVGPSFAGHPALAAPLPPSTSPGDPAFDPQGYWRGPQWPPITWLLWDGLRRLGHRRTAAGLRAAALAQLEAVGCCEYVHATTGEALGSPSQSWTAAVALDWLASEG